MHGLLALFTSSLSGGAPDHLAVFFGVFRRARDGIRLHEEASQRDLPLTDAAIAYWNAISHRKRVSHPAWFLLYQG